MKLQPENHESLTHDNFFLSRPLNGCQNSGLNKSSLCASSEPVVKCFHTHTHTHSVLYHHICYWFDLLLCESKSEIFSLFSFIVFFLLFSFYYVCQSIIPDDILQPINSSHSQRRKFQLFTRWRDQRFKEPSVWVLEGTDWAPSWGYELENGALFWSQWGLTAQNQWGEGVWFKFEWNGQNDWAFKLTISVGHVYLYVTLWWTDEGQVCPPLIQWQLEMDRWLSIHLNLILLSRFKLLYLIYCLNLSSATFLGLPNMLDYKTDCWCQVRHGDRLPKSIWAWKCANKTCSLFIKKTCRVQS